MTNNEVLLMLMLASYVSVQSRNTIIKKFDEITSSLVNVIVIVSDKF